MADERYTRSPQSAAEKAYAITPANAPLPNNVRAIYVGGTGDVVGIPIGNGTTEVTFVGVQGGTILPVMFKQISLATGATDIVGLLY